MKRTLRPWRGFVLETYECCGRRWELLLSRRFPERYGLPAPHCPTCGPWLLIVTLDSKLTPCQIENVTGLDSRFAKCDKESNASE